MKERLFEVSKEDENGMLNYEIIVNKDSSVQDLTEGLYELLSEIKEFKKIDINEILENLSKLVASNDNKLTEEERLQLLLSRAEQHAYMIHLSKIIQDKNILNEELRKFNDNIALLDQQIFKDDSSKLINIIRYGDYNYEGILAFQKEHGLNNDYINNEDQAMQLCDLIVIPATNQMSEEDNIDLCITSIISEILVLGPKGGFKYLSNDNGHMYINVEEGFDEEYGFIIKERYQYDFKGSTPQDLKNRLFDSLYQNDKPFIEYSMEALAIAYAYLTNGNIEEWFTKCMEHATYLLKATCYKSGINVYKEIKDYYFN